MLDFCTQCQTTHPRDINSPVYFTEDGSCLAADGWYLMHYDEADGVDFAWLSMAQEMIFDNPPERPLHKIRHHCGCFKLETHRQPQAMCRDCVIRRRQERLMQ